jgi:hypothetical protein
MNTKLIAGRRCASITALMQIKDVTEEDAQAIRRLWRYRPFRAGARAEIDKILRTAGVERLGTHKKHKCEVYYANGGDTYATTVLFVGMTLQVGTIGDLLDANLID